MNMIKTIPASELPRDWREEMGLSPEARVRVAVEEIKPLRSPEEVEQMLQDLRRFIPIPVTGDVTTFIRAERDRLDERNAR